MKHGQIAEYRTREGTRRMTLAAADASQAQRIASEWQLTDRLVAVVAVRAMQRPVFQLQAQ